MHRYIRNGAPTILVNILTGSSVEHTLRARISPKVRRHPPIRPLRSIVDKRLFLSSILAPCGASREIKLISPVMLITLEVARVAIKRTSIRMWLTFTPSILPSASSRESIMICLYNRKIISRQIAHSITFEPMEYMLMPLRLPMIQYSIDANCFSGSAVSFRHTRADCVLLCLPVLCFFHHVHMSAMTEAEPVSHSIWLRQKQIWLQTLFRTKTECQMRHLRLHLRIHL